MRVDLYDGNWLVEIDGYEYMIIGNKDDGYEVIKSDNDNILYYSSNDFEECLVWCYNS
ncbi:MAG: hypothetical protein J6S85_05090 [Methanobrevibacter sp.]|nr:hypothetical protein [Methanobrevibacter sp.]